MPGASASQLDPTAGRPTLYVIDGQAAIYRSYYAPFRDLTSPTGEPTRATYVFTQFLIKLIADRRPTYLAMALDVGDQETFRSTLYPEYKAHRDPPPDDLHVQKQRILELTQTMGVPLLKVAGFEADDIMATLAEQLGGQPLPGDGQATQPLHVVLVSRDKDLRQLVGPHVSLFDPMKDCFITPDSMMEEFGYGPELAVEVQALCGDTVDNVPGVKGVGEKTAAKLVTKYGSADAVLAAADEQTPKLRENLLAYAPMLATSRELVRLRRDVPVVLDLPQARMAGVDVQAILPLFDMLGFRRLVEQLEAIGVEDQGLPQQARSVSEGAASGDDEWNVNGDDVVVPTTDGREPPADGRAVATPTTTTADGKYELIDTLDKLTVLADQLRSAGAFAFDTETTDFACRTHELCGISFSVAGLEGCYVAIQTFRRGRPARLANASGGLPPALPDDDEHLAPGENVAGRGREAAPNAAEPLPAARAREAGLGSSAVPAKAVKKRGKKPTGDDAQLDLFGRSDVVGQATAAATSAGSTGVEGVSAAVSGDRSLTVAAGPQPAGALAAEAGRLALADVVRVLSPIFADAAIRKIAHNAKFDILALRSAGIPFAGLTFDTMLAAVVLDPGGIRGPHGLKEMGLARLGHASTTFAQLVGTGRDERCIDDVDVHDVMRYAAEDADVTWRLYGVLRDELCQTPTLAKLFEQLELPLVHVLADMEWEGIAVDAALLGDIHAEFSAELGRLEQEIFRLCGSEFTINSPKQLAEVLFDRLGFPSLRKTKTGRSTDADVLSELAYKMSVGTVEPAKKKAARGSRAGGRGPGATAGDDDARGSVAPAVSALKVDGPLADGRGSLDTLGSSAAPHSALAKLPQLILDYRELHKLLGTYVEPLRQLALGPTGRIHTRFHQAGAETGRLSSSDPNLQNIPIRTAVGRRIREAFIAKPGHVLISADYSQIELRILAHFSQDPGLLQAFSNDVDVHQFVASQVFNVPLSEVTKEQRGKAKAVNYGIAYGQTAFGLARTLRIPQPEAAAFIRDYRKRYQGITSFLDDCVALVRRHGYAETILGRRRYIQGIDDRNPGRRAMAERLAINTVVQGSAADLLKRAMLNVADRLRQDARPSRMLLTVHDELVFETPCEAAEADAAAIKHEMENALTLSVRVQADVGFARNWLAAK